MVDQEILQKLVDVDAKLDRMEKSVNATKNYLMWTFIMTIVVLVLPMIGLFFAIPALLSTYNAALSF